MSAVGPAAPCLHTPETLPAGDGPLRLELSCPQGRAQVTRYPVFPGIDLAYYDVHAPACALEEPVPGLLRISHCREGRMEYLHGGRFYFLAPGDLSVSCAQDPPREARFPTGHYHGITVTIDPRRAPDCLSCFLRDVDVRPGALIERFCSRDDFFISRSSPRVEHVFSELYCVPEHTRKGYFKVKILELLLFLSTFPVTPEELRTPGLSPSQAALAEAVRDLLLAHAGEKITGTQLSAALSVSETQLKAAFQAVYGMSPAAFLRAQRMHGAAQLLRSTNRTVLDIAGQFGYDNPSKFARAFRDVIGVSPNEYRCGIDRDSCAPDRAGS